MSQSGPVARAVAPYAEALFDLSHSAQLLEQTGKNLNLVREQIEKSSQLKTFLANPLFNAKVKKRVLSDLFLNQVSQHVLNFLHILVERRRIVLLDSIMRCYFDLVYNLQLVSFAEVSTAFPLTDLQRQAVQDKLKQMTGSSSIELVEHINPDLIGGLIIKIGSKVIDMSIYGQLNQMSAYLNKACIQ